MKEFLLRSATPLKGREQRTFPHLLMEVCVDAGAGDPAAQGGNPQGKASHRKGYSSDPMGWRAGDRAGWGSQSLCLVL